MYDAGVTGGGASAPPSKMIAPRIETYPPDSTKEYHRGAGAVLTSGRNTHV